jgi:hypothetical protein
MAQLTGNKIKDTYLGLLKTNGSGILTSGFQRITDGSGLGSQLYLSLTQIKFHDAYIFPNADGSADQVLSTDGSGVLSWKDDANSGTVTSVALSVPTGLTVTNSPITTSGTIAIANTSGYSIPTDAKQTQWDTAYTNRITTATSPLSITTNTISLNTVPVSNGGTGATTLTGILLGDGTNTITAITDGSADTFLKTDGSGGYSFSDVGGGDVLKTGTITQNKIAIWNDNDSTLRSDPTLTIDADHKITLFQPNPSGGDISNYNIGGGNQGIATGANNIGFGIDNLNSLTTGYSNIAIGYALEGTTTGYENICLGSNSLFYNDIGSRNICIGISSLFNNRSGTYNISIGYQSLVTTQTGINNIGIGKYSLQYSTGSGNIAIGSNSGSALATGSNNVIIGTATGSTIDGLSNRIIISDGGGNIRQTFDNSGDATFSGALSGTSATFSTGLIVSNIADVYPEIKTSAADADAFLGFSNTGDGNNGWSIGRRNTGEFWISNYTGNFNSGTRTQPLIIASTGAATFSGALNDSSVTIKQTSGATHLALKLWNNSTTGDSRFLRFFTEATEEYRGSIQYDRAGDRLGIYGGGNGLFFDGNATFSGALSGTSAVFTANEALTINANNSTAANNTITGFSANLYAISVRQKGVSAGIGGTNYMAQIISALGSEGLEIYTPNAKELILGTNSVPRLTIASTGAATFSGGYLSVSGNVATNNPPSSQGLSFGWNKSNGYGESLITYTNIGGGTVPRLDFGYWNGSTYSTQTTIFNSGNFLIGSSITDAGYKLDVDGTARFSGNITAANSSLLWEFLQVVMVLKLQYKVRQATLLNLEEQEQAVKVILSFKMVMVL